MQEEYYRQRRAEHASPKHSFAGATKVGASWLKCGEQRHGYAVRPMPPRDVLARGGAGILKEQ